MDLELEERYDFDTQRKHGEMPPILSGQYAMLFQMCQSRARALTRISQGWPRKHDEGMVKAVEGWLDEWGLSAAETARHFGFVDPPPQRLDVKPNTGTVFAAQGAALN